MHRGGHEPHGHGYMQDSQANNGGTNLCIVTFAFAIAGIFSPTHTIATNLGRYDVTPVLSSMATTLSVLRWGWGQERSCGNQMRAANYSHTDHETLPETCQKRLYFFQLGHHNAKTIGLGTLDFQLLRLVTAGSACVPAPIPPSHPTPVPLPTIHRNSSITLELSISKVPMKKKKSVIDRAPRSPRTCQAGGSGGVTWCVRWRTTGVEGRGQELGRPMPIKQGGGGGVTAQQQPQPVGPRK